MNDDYLITEADRLSEREAQALYERLQALADDRANQRLGGLSAGRVSRRVRQIRQRPRSTLAIVLAITVATAPFVALAASRLPEHRSPDRSEPVVPQRAFFGLPLGSVLENHDTTVIYGGSAAQRRVMTQILRGIDARLVPAVRILPKASSRHPINRASRNIWLSFPFPSGAGVASQLAAWQARLVAGAFRDESARLGLPSVTVATMAYPGYGPTSLHLIGSQAANLIRGSAPQLTTQIERSLRRMKLRPLTIAFARPSGLAPIVIAETTDPSATLTHWRPPGWPLNDSRYEGLFFEILNTDRQLVYFYAHTTRVPGGTGTGADIEPRK